MKILNRNQIEKLVDNKKLEIGDTCYTLEQENVSEGVFYVLKYYETYYWDIDLHEKHEKNRCELAYPDYDLKTETGLRENIINDIEKWSLNNGDGDGDFWWKYHNEKNPEEVEKIIKEAAEELFNNIFWEPGEMYIYADYDGIDYGFRQAGSFGDYEKFEQYVVCTVPTSYAYWGDTAAEWGFDPETKDNYDGKNDFLEWLADFIKY